MNQHLSLNQLAYNAIKEKLLNGDYEPGGRIREDLLAEEISMSRTPVREAINRLTTEGLVKNIPRKGIYFIELSQKEIHDLIDVRVCLEKLAIDLFIDIAVDDDIKKLDAIMSEFKEMLEQENYHACNELDSCFHQTIVEHSGNKKLIAFLHEIEDFMKIARNIEKKVSPKQKNEITLREHALIIEYAYKKDKPGAKQAIEANILKMKDNLGIE